MCQFKDKVNAQVAQVASVTAQTKYFCPQINGYCRTDCYCFNMGKVFAVGESTYGLIKAHCEHKLLKREA